MGPQERPGRRIGKGKSKGRGKAKGKDQSKGKARVSATAKARAELGDLDLCQRQRAKSSRLLAQRDVFEDDLGPRLRVCIRLAL